MKGMSIIVRTVCHWVSAFIFLYGLCIVVYGHLTPGGGFAGGVILACAFGLMVLALGKESAVRAFPVGSASKLDSIGALLFLIIAILGLFAGGGFFVNFLQKQHPGEEMALFNAGIIPLCNIAIAIKVCASLFLAVVVFSVLRVVGGGSDDEFASEEEE